MEEFSTNCFSFNSLGNDAEEKAEKSCNDCEYPGDYIEPFFLKPMQILPKKNEIENVEDIPLADIIHAQQVIKENYPISIPEIPQIPNDEGIKYWD